MEYQLINLRTKNSIEIITVNRPAALNSINVQVMNELEYYFSNIKSHPEIRGIIIRGEGEKSFVAGADIREFRGLNEHEAEKMAERGKKVFDLIEQCSIPVIAVINGFALGAGCELAMACHMRVAEEHARFGQPEINLGIIPGYGGTQRLIRYVGHGKAMELLLTGDMINAEEALNLGLVNYMVPTGEGIAKALHIQNKLSMKAPLAIQKIIACANAYNMGDSDGFELESKEFGRIMLTRDAVEGILAFVEKRKPIFKGQ